MSIEDDKEKLSCLIGSSIESFEVVESGYGDGHTSCVVVTLSNGSVVTLGSRGFSDGSSCLDVDVK